MKPRSRGSTLVRSADDAATAFADLQDASGSRMYRASVWRGTSSAPPSDKTRFCRLPQQPDDMEKDHPVTRWTTFTFLGFCHVWGKSRKGTNVARQVAARRASRRAPAGGVSRSVSANRHLSIPEQHARTGREDARDYAYYGISGNFRRLSRYADKVARIGQKWLSRRGSRFPSDRVQQPAESARLCQQARIVPPPTPP